MMCTHRLRKLAFHLLTTSPRPRYRGDRLDWERKEGPEGWEELFGFEEQVTICPSKCLSKYVQLYPRWDGRSLSKNGLLVPPLDNQEANITPLEKYRLCKECTYQKWKPGLDLKLKEDKRNWNNEHVRCVITLLCTSSARTEHETLSIIIIKVRSQDSSHLNNRCQTVQQLSLWNNMGCSHPL